MRKEKSCSECEHYEACMHLIVPEHEELRFCGKHFKEKKCCGEVVEPSHDTAKAFGVEKYIRDIAIKEFAEMLENSILSLLTTATSEKKEGIYACLDRIKEMTENDFKE